MQKRYKLVILALIISTPHLAAGPYPNPHKAQDKESCPQCHTQDMPALILPPIALCRKCHQPGTNDHPVGMIIKPQLPKGIPLDNHKKLVCHTCHNPHQKTNYPALLRMDFDALCMLCHKVR